MTDKCIYCGFKVVSPCRNSMEATGCINYGPRVIHEHEVPLEVVVVERQSPGEFVHYLTKSHGKQKYKRYPDGRWTVEKVVPLSENIPEIKRLTPDKPSALLEYLAEQRRIQKIADEGAAAIAAQYLQETGKKDAATAQTPRARVLNEAMEIVHKDRNANYGNPEDNFKQIGDLWAAYKKVSFTSADVAIMMGLVKVARLSVNPAHHDSAVDIAGYAACLGDIQHNLRASAAGSSNSGSSEPSQS